MISIKEFASTYGCNLYAVYKRIERNKRELEGHIQYGGKMMLDEYAEQLLVPKTGYKYLKAENEKLEKEIAELKKKLDEKRLERND